MKRSILTKLMFIAALFTIVSCNKNSNENYWEAFGTITNVSSTQTMTLLNDSGSTINITSTNTNFSTEYIGYRAYIYFTPTDENVTVDDDLINAELNFITFYYTRDAKLTNDISDSALTDYGSNNIEITNAWLGGGYANIYANVGYNDQSIADREFDLFIDTDKSTATNVYAKLMYRTTDLDSEKTYTFNSTTETLLCFKIPEYILDATDEVITFNIYNTVSDTTDTFEFNSDSSDQNGYMSVATTTTPIKFNM